MIDELTPIAIYMAGEMNRNAAGYDCRRMADLNAFSSSACLDDYLRAPWWQRVVGVQPEQCVQIELSDRAAAILIWTRNVAQNADWDHKPKLKKLLKSTLTGTYAWYIHGMQAYYYDVWSNT